MSLLISGDLRLRNTWQPMDTDAAAYITAVETADGQALEEKTKIAIDNFVLGCKADGIWDAIKASCILAGARTLAGALIPLVGTAPTNNGFIGIGTDYVRQTGLVGDGTKYLDSNFTYTGSFQNNSHTAINLTEQGSLKPVEFIGNGNTSGSTGFTRAGNGTEYIFRQVSASFAVLSNSSIGFLGASRNLSTSFLYRVGKANYSSNDTSATPLNLSHFVFDGRQAGRTSNARLAFYSIGESLDLALLDARVTALINAFAAAIP
jgi:hypothetical protein